MEQISLCYIMDPYWLSILNIAVCIHQSQIPNLSLPPHFRGGAQTLEKTLSLLKAAFETGMASENYHSSLRKIHGNL